MRYIIKPSNISNYDRAPEGTILKNNRQTKLNRGAKVTQASSVLWYINYQRKFSQNLLQGCTISYLLTRLEYLFLLMWWAIVSRERKLLQSRVHEAYASDSKPMVSSMKTSLRLQLLSVPSTKFHVIEARGLVCASANVDLPDVQIVRAHA